MLNNREKKQSQKSIVIWFCKYSILLNSLSKWTRWMDKCAWSRKNNTTKDGKVKSIKRRRRRRRRKPWAIQLNISFSNQPSYRSAFFLFFFFFLLYFFVLRCCRIFFNRLAVGRWNLIFFLSLRASCSFSICVRECVLDRLNFLLAF